MGVLITDTLSDWPRRKMKMSERGERKGGYRSEGAVQRTSVHSLLMMEMMGEVCGGCEV